MNTTKGFTYPKGSVWNQAPTDLNVALGGRFADRKGYAAAYLDYRTMGAIQKDRARLHELRRRPGRERPGLRRVGHVAVRPVPGVQRRRFKDQGLRARRDDRQHVQARTSATDVYNYAPANFMQRPDTGGLGGGFLNYKWNSHVRGLRRSHVHGRLHGRADRAVGRLRQHGAPQLRQPDDERPAAADALHRHGLRAERHSRTCTSTAATSRAAAASPSSVTRPSVSSFGLKGDLNKAWNYDVYCAAGRGALSRRSYATTSTPTASRTR